MNLCRRFSLSSIELNVSLLIDELEFASLSRLTREQRDLLCHFAYVFALNDDDLDGDDRTAGAGDK